MKYEYFKIGESYEWKDIQFKVISKSDEYKVITAINEKGKASVWEEHELEDFKPIKKEIPDTGLLVSKNGRIIYRNGSKSGYGFNSVGIFEERANWTFIIDPENWRTATKEDEEKFIEMLKKEAEKRGLGVRTKIKSHADGVIDYILNIGCYMPIEDYNSLCNENGRIFYNGIWAEPLTMLDEVCDAIKKHLPNIVIEMVDGVVTLKEL